MSRLSRNILYNLAGQALLFVLSFVAVRFVFRQLGAEAFGIILFTQTVNFLLVAVLELGISSTTVREISAHLHDDPAYVADVFRTGSLLYWTGYAVLAAVLIVLAPLLVEKWINLQALDATTATRMVQILGVATLLALPRSLYASLFRGLQRMAFTNVIDVGTSALQQLGIILILAYHGSLFAVIDWIAVSYLLGIAAYVLMASRFVPWRTLLPGFSATVVRRNRRFALHMMSISALATVHTQADKVVVSKLMPVGVLGYYSFASAVVTRATMVSSAVAQAAFPSFSDLFHRSQRPALMSQYGKLQTLISFSMVPLYAAITFAALPFFGYLFTPAIGQRLLAPTALLCAGFYLNSTLAVPYVFSLAVGKPEISVRQNVYAVFTVLPATVVLVALFGLVGAAASWVLYNLFAYAYGVPRICRECLLISPASWYAQIARAVALGAATYGTAWLLLAYFERLTLPYLVAGYVVGSAAFVLGAYGFIGPELRHTLIGLAPFRRRRVQSLTLPPRSPRK